RVRAAPSPSSWAAGAAASAAAGAARAARDLAAPALGAHERAQAFVLLAAGRAAVEVCAKPRDLGVRVPACELELDVPVQVLEAVVAAELGPGRAQKPRQRLLGVGAFHQRASSSQMSRSTPVDCR